MSNTRTIMADALYSLSCREEDRNPNSVPLTLLVEAQKLTFNGLFLRKNSALMSQVGMGATAPDWNGHIELLDNSNFSASVF